ncbi:MAG: copper resistance protein CopC [Armatimonadota bacterium]|nr:copper resistance protein CopC [Armatimonadota bacterium]MDR7400847.1 copper resistance protein CopC [Armatimonadota bacterium]MDR7404696.1 copper resistance protein CopC [Armatimonadota bacterium]MDR7437803.1 copper resistance protein CopC [Armatimonadota bacterium]MDR7473128.1 copper resistance protein CopC [Armatimonadota bacterium]
MLKVRVSAAAAVVLALAASAAAHARLVRSEPAAGAVLRSAPREVRAWFSEELDPGRSRLSVWDARGRQVDDGRGGVDLDDLDRRSMVARLRPVGPGTYTVRWRAVSADDGFVAEGQFRFTVRP